MKTFVQFINEAYDPEVQGRSQIRKTGEGGRVGANRKKSEPEKRRMKTAGGGKMVPLRITNHAKILVHRDNVARESSNQHRQEDLQERHN